MGAVHHHHVSPPDFVCTAGCLPLFSSPLHNIITRPSLPNICIFPHRVQRTIWKIHWTCAGWTSLRTFPYRRGGLGLYQVKCCVEPHYYGVPNCFRRCRIFPPPP